MSLSVAMAGISQFADYLPTQMGFAVALPILAYRLHRLAGYRFMMPTTPASSSPSAQFGRGTCCVIDPCTTSSPVV